jgi:hypothetical protein
MGDFSVLVATAPRRHRESARMGQMLGTPKLVFVAVVGFLFGSIMLISWLPRLMVANSPVVTGNVRARAPITEWGVPRVDFTIEIPKTLEVVHARTQRYLLDRVPAQVRFHYSGDPSRQVYLFEHEENPLWIGLFCWAVSAILGTIVYHRWSSVRGFGPPN